MKYLLVFITVWSFSSAPEGSWSYKHYVWNDTKQDCIDRAGVETRAANAVRFQQWIDRMDSSRPTMYLVDASHYCYSEEEVEKIQNGTY